MPQALSLQSSLSSPRLHHQSSAPSSGLGTPLALEHSHSTGLQLQCSVGDIDQVCSDGNTYMLFTDSEQLSVRAGAQAYRVLLVVLHMHRQPSHHACHERAFKLFLPFCA